MQPQKSTKPSFNQCNARTLHWARGVSRDVKDCPDPQGVLVSYSPGQRHNSTVFVKSRPWKVSRGGRTLHIIQSGILFMSEILKCRCSQWVLDSTNFSWGGAEVPDLVPWPNSQPTNMAVGSLALEPERDEAHSARETKSVTASVTPHASPTSSTSAVTWVTCLGHRYMCT